MNALDSRRVRATLVDGDLLGHSVQIDGALQKAPGGGTVFLGTKQEIDRVVVTIDGPVQVFPLAWFSFDRFRVAQASASRPGRLAVSSLVESNCEGFEPALRGERQAGAKRWKPSSSSQCA